VEAYVKDQEHLIGRTFDTVVKMKYPPNILNKKRYMRNVLHVYHKCYQLHTFCLHNAAALEYILDGCMPVPPID
ncbi:hypothetical protein KIPB_017027, partial [Kipferlia bialata]